METGNWRLETGKWKLGIGQWKFETGKRKLELEDGNWELETGRPKLGGCGCMVLKSEISNLKFLFGELTPQSDTV
jgi:hypothetical protein